MVNFALEQQEQQGGQQMAVIRSSDGLLSQLSEDSIVLREHLRPPAWDRDSYFTKCTACDIEFGAFRRRHHCRACGVILCYNCSSYRVEKYFRSCESCCMNRRLAVFMHRDEDITKFMELYLLNMDKTYGPCTLEEPTFGKNTSEASRECSSCAMEIFSNSMFGSVAYSPSHNCLACGRIVCKDCFSPDLLDLGAACKQCVLRGNHRRFFLSWADEREFCYLFVVQFRQRIAVEAARQDCKENCLDLSRIPKDLASWAAANPVICTNLTLSAK